jgi:hypothetical protein
MLVAADACCYRACSPVYWLLHARSPSFIDGLLPAALSLSLSFSLATLAGGLASDTDCRCCLLLLNLPAGLLAAALSLSFLLSLSLNSFAGDFVLDAGCR